MKVPPGWDSIRLGAGAWSNLGLLSPQKCPGAVSWDDLAHRAAKGFGDQCLMPLPKFLQAWIQ